MSDWTSLSLAALARALARRETTALAVVEAHLARIRDTEARTGAFVEVRAEEALVAAAAADAARAAGRAGPLAGIPVAVKDLFAVRGCVRGCGSPAFAGDAPAPHDAAAVARLRAAGAVVVGTTHLHELAFGATGVNPALGTPVNPWGADRVPGGSSSGSAVAVAARLASAALGTDTGASIRVPAAFCGVSGLKPTYGRVSRAGVMPLAWTLDHVGPIARSAEDLALVLQAIAGHDPADPASARVPVPDYTAALERPLRGVRLGVPRHFALAVADAGIAALFERALADLRAAGAVVTDVEIPALAHAAPALGAVILAEATAGLLPRLGARADRVGPEARMRLETGRALGAHHYLAAQRLRTRLYEETRAALARADLLVMPMTVLSPPPIGALRVRVGDVDLGVEEAITRLSGPFNLTGLPALAVPCGFTDEGLPASLQLVGRPFAEGDVLAVGHAYQRATDWHHRAPA
ncbi:MAG TPA: amidase [Candidatus Binatia bacterium]|nr:amidase [Candidatus Binatia bacterium]